MKITIMGGGGVVGSSAAFRIAQEGLASEIVLVDARENMAKAHALDIEQAVVHRSTTQVKAGGIEETKDSNVVLIAVGVLGLSASQPSRLSQFEDNIAILKDLMKPLISYSPSALWMMATVPLDPIIYLFHKHFSIPRQKMIGVNRNDTSRFRWAIGKILSVPAPSVEAFVLGEHGETQVPLFSSIRIRGERISLTPEQVEQIRNQGMDCYKALGLRLDAKN